MWTVFWANCFSSVCITDELDDKQKYGIYEFDWDES